MKKKIVLILFCICVLNIPLSIAQTIEQQEAEARQVLNNLEPQLHSRRNTVTEASWAYASNITDANLQKQNEASADFAVFLKVRHCYTVA